MSAMKLVLLAALLAASASAISITWTGYGGDNQWTNKINWSPDQVPTTADDVTINQGVVLVTIATGCNSLVMGTSFNGPANLTVFQAFFIGTGGLSIEGNGNLFINSGTAAVTGQVTVAGNLYFQSGTLSGQWQITNRGVADLSGPAQKAFTGCQFSSAAMSFIFSGVMALNQSSQIIVTSALVMSGDVSIQAQDSTQVLVDTSAGTLTYTGNGDLQIQAPVNIGTFNFQGGNLTIYDDITFKNPFVIPSTSFVATVGSAVANMSAGVSGAGVLTAAGANILLGNTSITGAFNLVGGNATFGAAGSNIALFTISGGFAVLNFAVKTAQLNLLAGNIVGPAAITATQLYSNSQGFNLDAPIVVAGNASLGGLVAFGSTGSISIAAAASANAIASLTFTGVPGQTVTNMGTLVVSNPVVFQNINLAGSGKVTVSSSLQIQSATIAQSSVALSGAGSFKGSSTQITGIAAISAPSVVYAVIGSYSLTCQKECDNVSTAGTPASSFQFTA